MKFALLYLVHIGRSFMNDDSTTCRNQKKTAIQITQIFIFSL